MEKPNCYECLYRRNLPGDAHSSCAHPRRPALTGVMSIFNEMTGGVKVPGVPTENAIKVTGNLHGILSGWFMWPSNFDPVWLDSCEGFEPKETSK